MRDERPDAAGSTETGSADRPRPDAGDRAAGQPPVPGGEARPASARLLARPPGDRYRRASPGRSASTVRARPRMGRALAGGAVVAAVLAGLLAIFHAVLWGGLGQTTILVLGAWAIGVTVRGLAWGGAPHRASRAPVAIAALLGAAAWAGAMAAAWLLSLALLPNSVRTFAERIAGTPFTEWIGPQLTPFRFVEGLLIVAIAAFAARSAAVPAGDDAA